MTLNSDTDGFLIGEVVADIRRSEMLLGIMKTDISAIKSAILGFDLQSRRAQRSEPNRTAETTSVTPRRNSQGPHTEALGNGAELAEPTNRVTRDSQGRFASRTNGSDENSGRDSRGRFTSNSSDEDTKQNSILGGIADKISGAIVNTGDMDNIDPAINAFNEVAQPLSRGYQAIFSGTKEKKQNSWFGKIFKELKLSRTQDSEYNRASQRVLDDIEENTVGNGSSSSSSSGVSMPSMSGVGGMMGVLKIIPALSKGLLKKIPLIGGLLSTLAAGFDIFGNESDDSLTRREKDQKNGSAAGGAAGTIGGMFAGAKMGAMVGAFAGPIGAAIGTAVGGAAGMFFGDQAGQIIGEQIGSWTNDLRSADIPGMITSTWSAAIAGFSVAWDGMKEASEKALGWISDKADYANNLIKEKTGIDVKEIAGTLKDKASVIGGDLLEKGKAAKSWFGSKLDSAVSWASENTSIGKGVSAAKETFSKSRAKYKSNSGNNKKALMSQMKKDGITNPNEQAMFLAQMDHESGGFKKLEENLNYSPERLLQISGKAKKGGIEKAKKAVSGGPEGIAELLYGGRKDLGNTEKGDGYRFRGRGYTQLTGRSNYASASKDLGIDLVNNPDLAAKPETAAKIATWFHKKNKGLVSASRSGDVKQARKLVNGGLNGVSDVQDKFKHYQKIANSGGINIPKIKANQVAKSTSIPSPKAPKITSAQKFSDAPRIPTPALNSHDKKPIIVAINKADAAQDVGDRNIAMIATGGLSKS